MPWRGQEDFLDSRYRKDLYAVSQSTFNQLWNYLQGRHFMLRIRRVMALSPCKNPSLPFQNYKKLLISSEPLLGDTSDYCICVLVRSTETIEKQNIV